MNAPILPRLPRRQFANIGIGVFTLGLGNLHAMIGCGNRGSANDQRCRCQVSGPSMNPTLWGPSRTFDCESCGATIRVDSLLMQLAQEGLPKRSPSRSAEMCWHCGSPIAGTKLSTAMRGTELPPDVVEVDLRATTTCEVGDILLIDKNGLQVKRLLGKPGQTVSLDDTGRLLIDRQRPRFGSLPFVAVDTDRLRQSSRWQGHGEPTRWHRQQDRTWTTQGDTDWLVYSHQNVYRGPRPSRVLDDYPGNLGIERALLPADGLSVKFDLARQSGQDHGEIVCWIAFWTEQGINLHQRLVRVDSKLSVKVEVGSRDTLPVTQQNDHGTESAQLLAKILSPQRPVAVRLSQSREHRMIIDDLAVCRDVLYRINPPGPRRGIIDKYRPPTYPMLLGEDEWFVVGDNVPLSIDSRYWGAVISDEIMGRVEAIR